MNNTIVIKIESGVVADVYVSEPADIIIVDHDMIEGGESFEQRVLKSVFSHRSEKCVIPDHVDALVTSLVLECKRPLDGQDLVLMDQPAGATA